MNLLMNFNEEEQGISHNKEEVQCATFQKWQREFDRDCKTVTCKAVVEGGTKVVRKLKCTVCTWFRSQILCKQNFRDQWINGVYTPVIYVTTLVVNSIAMRWLCCKERQQQQQDRVQLLSS